MQPDVSKITIRDNETQITELLGDLVLQPRILALKWSKITKQTPNMKVGYPAQHLASLVTGMEGSRTGARGKDIVDGSEVKACSKIDQLDTCMDCKEKVSRAETVCPFCGSDKIKRMDDSKWLFTIRSEAELDLLINETQRIVLVVAFYPKFDIGDFNEIRIEVFELWTNSPRNSNFKHYMTDYYHNIFSKHRASDPSKTPAPKNFFPYGYPFYMCNPIKVFSANIVNANTTPGITIDHYIQPDQDREHLDSESMPTVLLNRTEIEFITLKLSDADIQTLLHQDYTLEDYNTAKALLRINDLKKMIPFLPESFRSLLSLREVGEIRVAKQPYQRGGGRA